MLSLNGLLGAFAPPTPPIVHWQGASGRWYAHSVFSIRAIPDWIAACNYIFTAPRPDGLRSTLYVGESGEFDVRLAQHEKLPDVLRLVLSASAARQTGAALASMLVYVAMAAILAFRPVGLFPVRRT